MVGHRLIEWTPQVGGVSKRRDLSSYLHDNIVSQHRQAIPSVWVCVRFLQGGSWSRAEASSAPTNWPLGPPPHRGKPGLELASALGWVGLAPRKIAPRPPSIFALAS